MIHLKLTINSVPDRGTAQTVERPSIVFNPLLVASLQCLG